MRLLILRGVRQHMQRAAIGIEGLAHHHACLGNWIRASQSGEADMHIEVTGDLRQREVTDVGRAPNVITARNDIELAVRSSERRTSGDWRADVQRYVRAADLAGHDAVIK